MSFGFDTALSALSAARLALQTIGHNIANANTPGYSRQRVMLSEGLPQSIGPGLATGTGVRLTSIQAVTDQLLTSRVRAQRQDLGFATAQNEVYTDVESALGEPGTGALNSLLSAFYTSVDNLHTAPADPAARTAVIQNAQSIASGFRTARGNLASVHSDVQASIGQEVTGINQLLADLDGVNRAIATQGYGGTTPPDLVDQQNQILSDLSQSLDVSVNTTQSGQVVVYSGGQVLVDPNGAHPLRTVQTSSAGGTSVRVGRSNTDLKPRAGRLAGLLELEPTVGQDHVDAMDQLARSFIRSVNQAHATGVPPSGGFSTLIALHGFKDSNADGSVLDEPVARAGLPFEVDDGFLTVTVRNTADNSTNQVRIPIDTGQTTVQNLRDALSSVAHLSASVDSSGRLRVSADSGFQFDFSGRLNPTPNLAGSIGSDHATVVGPSTFPLSITTGDSFQIRVDGGPPQAVTFNTSSFANPSQATAAEVAASINSQVSGAHAQVVNGQLVLQSNSTGTASSLQVTDGTGQPAAVLGLPSSLVSGQAHAVSVRVSGAYTGTTDRGLTLRPLSDGVIGQTNGLKLQVVDQSGSVLGTLDVGEGYEPGSAIDLGDGVKISLSAGSVRASSNEFVHVDEVANGDTSGILSAAGINAVYTGTDAQTIAVRSDLSADQTLLATGRGGGPSDASNIANLLASRDRTQVELGNRSVIDRYQALVTEVGFSSQRATTTVQTQQSLLDQAQNRLQSVSGVSIDEELVNMQTFQKSFEVAARFAQTLQEVNTTLINMVS